MKNRKLSDFEALTILILVALGFLYEVGFCNITAITVEKTYNFSLFRILMYVVFAIFYKKFSHSFIEKAEQTVKEKKKVLIIYCIFCIIFYLYIIFNEPYTYTIILTLIAELSGLLLILYITKDYIKNIIVSTLTLGFILSITTSVYHIVDEKKHFMSALNLAVGNINYNMPLTDETFDNIPFDSYTEYVARNYFDKKCNLEMKEYPLDEKEEEESIYSTPATNNPILYLPSSIGINLARLFGGSYADAFFAGRSFNLFAVSALIVIIFKILPFKKNIFYVAYLLPLTLLFASTYSVDAITACVVGIFIAYVLKLYSRKDEEFKFKNFINLLLLFICVLICKNGIYLGISLLVLILPLKKILKNNKAIIPIFSILLLLALTIGLYQANNLTKSNDGDVRVSDTSPSRQLEYLIDNPLHIVEVYKNYIRSSLFNLNWYQGFNLKVFFGKNAVMMTYILFIFVLYTAFTDNSYTFNKKEKSVFVVTFLAVYFITTLILYLAYTKVGATTINGYQARYLIPVLPLALLGINMKEVNKQSNNKNYNSICLISAIISIIDVMLTILI